MNKDMRIFNGLMENAKSFNIVPAHLLSSAGFVMNCLILKWATAQKVKVYCG
jgi:hypothetical protein